MKRRLIFGSFKIRMAKSYIEQIHQHGFVYFLNEFIQKFITNVKVVVVVVVVTVVVKQRVCVSQHTMTADSNISNIIIIS